MLFVDSPEHKFEKHGCLMGLNMTSVTGERLPHEIRMSKFVFKRFFE